MRRSFYASLSFSSFIAAGFFAALAVVFMLPPHISPVDEIALQAALATPEPASAADPTLNATLREIEIRSALEDHRRLHYELG